MIEIIDIGQLKAARYAKRQKRIDELSRMIHVCDIAHKSTLDIQDSNRFQFSNIILKYRKLWRKELDNLEQRNVK